MKILRSLKKSLKARKIVSIAFAQPEKTPVLIYQMGKVGSSTINKTLKNSKLSNQVLHLHFLSDDLTERLKKFKKAGKYPFADHFYISQHTRTALGKDKDRPVKIITLLRDPIAIVVSNLMQNAYLSRKSITTNEGAIDAGKATDYLQDILSKADTFNYIYEWFDKELKTVFGMDVLNEEFPVQTGYARYTKGNVEVLVIRLEDLSENGPVILSSFLGLDKSLELKNDNLRSASKDSDVYDEVLQNIKISPLLCRKIYASNFVRHFYDDRDINKFISKWTKSEASCRV